MITSSFVNVKYGPAVTENSLIGEYLRSQKAVPWLLSKLYWPKSERLRSEKRNFENVINAARLCP